jgi:plastocyanin
MNVARPLRIAAAIALLIGGLVHLQLYFRGYRSIDKIGPSFLLNAIASGVVAAVLVARREWLVRLAGMGVAAATIVASIIAHEGNGLFNFREHGLKPSPEAMIALVAEIAVIVLLAATFLPSLTDSADGPAWVVGISASVAAIALVGLGAYWSRHFDQSTQLTTQDGVRIANFAFGPADLNVRAGSTVTWINGDAVAHSVVASDTSFFSGDISTGKTFDHTFDTAGAFTYVCGIHPKMKGTVTVSG